MVPSKPPSLVKSQFAAATFPIHEDEDSRDTTTNAASLLDGGDTASLSIMGDLFTNALQDDDNSIDSRPSRGRPSDVSKFFRLLYLFNRFLDEDCTTCF